MHYFIVNGHRGVVRSCGGKHQHHAFEAIKHWGMCSSLCVCVIMNVYYLTITGYRGVASSCGGKHQHAVWDQEGGTAQHQHWLALSPKGNRKVLLLTQLIFAEQ